MSNPKKQQENRNSLRWKQGITTLGVMVIMALASIIAAGVYRALTAEDRVSAARFHEGSAEAAARAGIATTKAWFGHDAKAAITVLNNWLDESQSTGDHPGVWELNPQSGFAATALRNQRFRVFLQDFEFDEEPMAVKIQSVGFGQGGSRKVVTSVFALEGLVLQNDYIATTSSSSSSSSVFVGGFEDALYIHGGLTNMDQNTNVEGSMYVDQSLKINDGNPEINGDLVIGDAGSVEHWNSGVHVKGNFLSLVEISWQNGDLNVDSSVYLSETLTENLNNNVNIGNDLRIDGHINHLKKTWTIGGNAYFKQGFKLEDGGKIAIEGDAIVGDESALGANVLDFQNSGDISIRGDAMFIGTATNGFDVNMTNSGVVQNICILSNDLASWSNIDLTKGSEDLIHTAGSWSALPSVCKNLAGFANTEDHGFISRSVNSVPWSCDTLLTNGSSGASTFRLPRCLNYIEKNLVDGNKPQPPSLKDALLSDSAKTWSELTSHYSGTGSDEFEVSVANDIYKDMIASNDTVGRYKDFLVINANNNASMWNKTPNDLLDGHFIFLNVNTAVNGKFPGSTSDSRVLVQITDTEGAVGFGTYQKLYGMIQVEGPSGTNKPFSSLDVEGAVTFLNGTGVQMNSVDAKPNNFKYDANVVSDLVGLGIFQNSSSDTTTVAPPTTTPPTTTTTPGVKTLVLLSPRLKLNLRSQFEGEEMVDTTNVKAPATGLLILPPVIYAGRVTGMTTEQFVSASGVDFSYTDKPDGVNCDYQKISDNVDFSTTGQYAVVYTPNCDSGEEQPSTLWINVNENTEVPHGEVWAYIGGGATVREPGTHKLFVYLKANNAEGASTITLSFSGSSATIGSDVSVSPITIDIPDGYNNTSPLSGRALAETKIIDIDILDDSEKNEPDEHLFVTLIGSGSSLIIKEPKTATVLIKEDPDDIETFTVKALRPNGGNIYRAPAESLYHANDAVSLISSETPCKEFLNWSNVSCQNGNSSPTCEIIVTSNVTATANFIDKDVILDTLSPPISGLGNFSYSVNGGIAESWTNLPKSLSCGSDVTFTASPEGGSSFNAWTGDLAGLDEALSSRTMTINNSTKVGASFGGSANCIADLSIYDGSTTPTWISHNWSNLKGESSKNSSHPGFDGDAYGFETNQSGNFRGTMDLPNSTYDFSGGVLRLAFRSIGAKPASVKIALQDNLGNVSNSLTIENPAVARIHSFAAALFDKTGFNMSNVTDVVFEVNGAASSTVEYWFDSFEFDCPSAVTPDIISPASGEDVRSSTFRIVWNPVKDADNYELWIGTSSGGSDLLKVENLSRNTTSYTYLGIPMSTTSGNIYAKVRAITPSGPSSWDNGYWDVVAIPELRDCGDVLSSTSHSFTWDAVSGVERHFFKLGTTAGSSDIDLDSAGTTGSTVTGLPADGSTLYAAVRALYNSEYTDWHSCSYTAWSDPANMIPTITAPSTITGTTAIFEWTEISGATKYEVWVYSDDATNYDSKTTVASNNITISTLPESYSELYVKVRAEVDGSWKGWSSVKIY